MNFLSHYAYDQIAGDSLFNLGLLFPDFLGMIDRSVRVKKLVGKEFSVDGKRIVKGIERHLLRDDQFHVSDFFKVSTSDVKKLLTFYGFSQRPFRPFFIAHIAVELFLDRYLLLQDAECADLLYADLEKISQEQLDEFLADAGQEGNISSFTTFLQRFLGSKYIYQYAQDESIIYSLNRISERVGNPKFDFADSQQLQSFVQSVDEIIQTNYHLLSKK